MDEFIPKISSVVLSLSRDAKFIFNDFLSDDLVLPVLFIALSCCIHQYFELCVAVQYSFHLHQCQVHLFFYFVQDLPDIREIVFPELPPLLTLLLSPLLFLFLSWESKCLENRILRSWIWLVRAKISTSFSDFVSYCPSSTNDSYLTTMSRMKSSRLIFVPSYYFSWKRPM